MFNISEYYHDWNENENKLGECGKTNFFFIHQISVLLLSPVVD